ncbi:hypothetical protein EVAR_93233_1 [Eumeta japonica]|uniref:Uncharacterized protein n=1 Tax=Eumeta variegata TaxID=151549 RepID=A0A4C1TXN5_EUMVA|nr:hypothetical protein EVAR_93233_1 [Eumeta japonica]
MLEEMLRAEAASAMEHYALPNRRLRIQISDIHSSGDAFKFLLFDDPSFLYWKQDEEQNRKSRADEDGIERGIKIRTKSMFGIGIRNGADVRNQSGAS